MRDEIELRLKGLRAKCRPITNCYAFDVFDLASQIWNYEDSFCFAYDDHGVKRVEFFAANKDELAKLIKKVPKGTYYLEYMTKELDELADIFANEKLITRLKRVANPDCSSVFENEQVMQFEDESISIIPEPEDAEEINEMLWNTFHTEVSHLLNKQEMVEAIERREITVHKDAEGKIDAVLHVVMQPKRFYTNHAVNHGDKKIINAMFISRLREYHNAGGKYINCWVPEDNIASLKWNGKYGMVPDGMLNVIYCLER